MLCDITPKIIGAVILLVKGLYSIKQQKIKGSGYEYSLLPKRVRSMTTFVLLFSIKYITIQNSHLFLIVNVIRLVWS